ncbi:hypothetical protein AC628_37705, partial [Bradyrhizobium sp. NAS96.2]
MERSEIREVVPRGAIPGLRFAPSGLRGDLGYSSPCTFGISWVGRIAGAGAAGGGAVCPTVGTSACWTGLGAAAAWGLGRLRRSCGLLGRRGCYGLGG